MGIIYNIHLLAFANYNKLQQIQLKKGAVMSQKKRSLLSWIFTFAGKKKPIYFVSVFFAILRVACGMAPYILIANIVRELLDGVRDWNLYLKQCAIVAAFWLGVPSRGFQYSLTKWIRIY